MRHRSYLRHLLYRTLLSMTFGVLSAFFIMALARVPEEMETLSRFLTLVAVLSVFYFILILICMRIKSK